MSVRGCAGALFDECRQACEIGEAAVHANIELIGEDQRNEFVTVAAGESSVPDTEITLAPLRSCRAAFHTSEHELEELVSAWRTMLVISERDPQIGCDVPID